MPEHVARFGDTNLVVRAVLILGLVAFGFYLAAERGFLSLALDADRSRISYVILALYGLASLHWLYLSQVLTRERGHLADMARELESDEADLGRVQRGLIGQFLRDWQTKGGRGSPEPLLTAFGDELVNRHALGHFVSDALLKLGLLGTIVGFILMLLPVGEIEEFDPAVLQQLLAAMSGGMAVALYTTLAGLVTSTLLKLQYHVLDASAADLATRLAVLADIHLTHDAT